MTQPPNYVVRQDAGGKLKLLLIRDPRAAHVARISPVKKQPETTVSLSSAPQRAATSSSSVHVTITPAVAAPTTLCLSDRPTVGVTSSSASSSSFGSSLSPTLLTHAASQAMGQATSTSGALTTSGKVGGGGGERKADGMRAKGGKIVKLSSSKSPKKSTKLHSSVIHTTSTHSLSTSDSSQSSRPVAKTDHMLPVSRVRTIMRTDVHTSNTTQSIGQDAVALVAKATKLFIAQLAREAHKVAVSAAERDVSYRHLSTAVRRGKRTEFLHDILPGKVVVRDYMVSLGNHTDHTHNSNNSASSSE